MHLPKYIWLLELSIIEYGSISDYFYNPDYVARPIDGEFLYDATSPPTDVRMLSAKISGIYMDYTDQFRKKLKIKKKNWNNCYESSSKEGECNECRKK